MAAVVCPICLDALDDWNGDEKVPVEAMTCGHSFRAECLEKGVNDHSASGGAMRCPVCKRTADDMVASEGTLEVAEAAAASDAIAEQSAAGAADAEPAAAPGTDNTTGSGPAIESSQRVCAAESADQATVEQLFAIPKAQCELCKGQVEMVRARTMPKWKGTFRCTTCMSKCVMLTKHFGKWQVQGWSDVPLDLQE